MTKVDQFESVFRAATREVYHFEPVAIESVLVVTDREGEEAEDVARGLRSFLSVIDARGEVQWKTVAGSEFSTAEQLLARIESDQPDLICTYRNLHSEAWRYPFSLGQFLDVLTQATTTPVLVIPHPESGREFDHALRDTNTVMAVTDHLTGDSRLVNFAASFTEPKGALWLTHVEDEAIFERYMDAISKIPEIDTDSAREEIAARLLRDPSVYIDSIRSALSDKQPALKIKSEISFGGHVDYYRNLIEAHEIDLLVFNTKDQDQDAMHGLAYPLAVELRQIPLLML